MRKNRIILPLLSVFLGVLLLLGSTGITLIIHQCDSCQDYSVHAGIYLSQSIPEDHCCESAINHCSTHSENSPAIGCCHFTIEKLKITNYTTSAPVTVSLPAIFAPVSYLPDVYSIIKRPAKPVLYYNKHGARDTITFYCQFLA